MNHICHKTLLFLEPCYLSYPLLQNVYEKGETTLVISNISPCQTIPKDIIKVSSLYFQVDLNDEDAVFDLIHKIKRVFTIDGVIPGNEYYLPLVGKIATTLNKPSLLASSALAYLETSQIFEGYPQDTEGIDYKVDVLVKDYSLYFLNITEIISLSNQEREYLIRANLEKDLFVLIETFVKKIISDFKINHGPFSLDLRVNQGNCVLKDMALSLPHGDIPKLITFARGIDYYDTFLNLMSGL